MLRMEPWKITQWMLHNMDHHCWKKLRMSILALSSLDKLYLPKVVHCSHNVSSNINSTQNKIEHNVHKYFDRQFDWIFILLPYPLQNLEATRQLATSTHCKREPIPARRKWAFKTLKASWHKTTSAFTMKNIRRIISRDYFSSVCVYCRILLTYHQFPQ